MAADEPSGSGIQAPGRLFICLFAKATQFIVQRPQARTSFVLGVGGGFDSTAIMIFPSSRSSQGGKQRLVRFVGGTPERSAMGTRDVCLNRDFVRHAEDTPFCREELSARSGGAVAVC